MIFNKEATTRGEYKSTQRMDSVEITIDSKQVNVEKGRTILEVARSLRIDIPTLCYHPALEPYGACRVCLVEITKPQWNGYSRLVVSCAYPVEDDLIVYTNSEKVIKARKFVLELLIARVPKSEIIRNLANQYGVSESRFSATINYQLSTINCILCGLCVRVCSELIGESAISFVARGINRKVIPPFDKPSEVCLTCGACAFVCPTGAIKLEDILSKRTVSISKKESELVSCKNCNTNFIPLPVSEKIKQKFYELQDIFDLCPKCRRKVTAYNTAI